MSVSIPIEPGDNSAFADKLRRWFMRHILEHHDLHRSRYGVGVGIDFKTNAFRFVDSDGRMRVLVLKAAIVDDITTMVTGWYYEEGE